MKMIRFLKIFARAVKNFGYISVGAFAAVLVERGVHGELAAGLGLAGIVVVFASLIIKTISIQETIGEMFSEVEE